MGFFTDHMTDPDHLQDFYPSPFKDISFPDPRATAEHVIQVLNAGPEGVNIDKEAVATLKYVAQELIKALDKVEELLKEIRVINTWNDSEYRIVQDPEFWSSRRISGGD